MLLHTKMNAQTVGWFLFLTVTKYFSHASTVFFKLDDSHLTATEGSCIEIRCRVTNGVDDSDAHWFWMKDAVWDSNKSHYNATIIYSTDKLLRPVSPDYEGRVTYTGTPSSNWSSNSHSRFCNILICNLNKTDSGLYSFRFFGKEVKWETKPALNLTIKDNPCPITFKKPPAVNELGTITLTCSTLSSCPSDIQIDDLSQVPQAQPSRKTDEKLKSTTVHFRAMWQHDGKKFSCRTTDNKNIDRYLIRNVSLTVEYAPKEAVAKISPTNIWEGQNVSLTCTANGSPAPNISWVYNETLVSGKEWMKKSIQSSDSGRYYCEAQNKHGTLQSNSVVIDVTYHPEVELKMKSTVSELTQGDGMTLTCIIKRSNPEPYEFSWFKDSTKINGQTNQYDTFMQPEDSGNYTCCARNTVGNGCSQAIDIKVRYTPRNTNVLISKDKLKLNESVTFTCKTDAHPGPDRYSWYRYSNNKRIDSSLWTSRTTDTSELILAHVQRTDEACYMCNATNVIGTGENSRPACISNIHYPPTNLKLSMDTEAREGQLINIRCTVESFPPSHLSLKRSSLTNSPSSEWSFSKSDRPNSLKYTFNASSIHTGFYTCVAENSESSTRTQRKLVVRYRPKDVRVQPRSGLILAENASLTLRCSAQSHPEVTSFTWMKMTDGKTEIIERSQILNINSVSLSDGGLYRCEATNEMGTGQSESAEVKVKYAPKDTKITRGAEQQLPDGTSSVALSCSSHSYPPVRHYSWYKKMEPGERDIKVSDIQNHTVYSDQPGKYYCIAKNEINQSLSDTVALFVDRVLMMVLKISLLFLIILFVIISFLIIYRHKRKKSVRQGTTSAPPCFGLLGWWTCARRRDLLNEPVMAEPSRSRDDLLPDQAFRPKPQRRQPRPDDTPASNINSVYCTVNLPAGKQGPSAQKPIRPQGGHTEEGSLNYISLHFGNKQKNRTAVEEDIVYAKVSKEKPPKMDEQERRADYENVSAAKTPKSQNYDSDTSEDEVELNYSQVSFKAKPGRQRAGRDSSSDSSSDSSTSDEEEIKYSEVKI